MKTTAQRLHNGDEDEPKSLPVTPEIIDTVLNRSEHDILLSSHIRFIRRHANKMRNGRITLVIENSQIVAIERTQTFAFSHEQEND